jgi:hypothetical protein
MGNRLIVRNDRLGQKSVSQYIAGRRNFVEQVRMVEPDGKPPQKPLDPALVPGHSQPEIETPWEKALRTKLEKTVGFDFKDKPFPEVLEFIRNECHVNLVVTPGALTATVNSPITLRVTEMSAELALRWVLKHANLEYNLRDEAVQVFQGMIIDSVRISDYYARDLSSVMPLPDLMALLSNCVLTVSLFQDMDKSVGNHDGILTITQSPYAQPRIEAFFDQFRLHAADVVFYPNHVAHNMKEPYPDHDCAIFNLSDLSESEVTALATAFKTRFADAPGDESPRLIRAAGKRLIVCHTSKVREDIAKKLEEVRRAK